MSDSPTREPDLFADNPSEAEDYGQAVVDAEALAALKTRSDAKGLTQFGLHILFIVCTGVLVSTAMGRWWLLLAMLIHGVGLVYLFAGMHETIHRTAFKSRWLNDTVAWLTGLVVCLPPEGFRSFHFAHHRYTQIPGKDPELDVKQPDSFAGYLWYVSGISYWIRAFQGIFKAALGNVTAPYISERVKPLVVREARIFGLIYLIALGAAFAGYSESLLYWFLPMVMAQPFWRGWLLAEHTGCTNDDDIYANTRTTYTNPLLRFLLWQMPYHVAHHAYPGIPFFALQDADALIRGRAGAKSPGYLSFHRQWISRIRTAR